jgi:transposase-like protein
VVCKFCGHEHYTKNGIVRGFQRYKCKLCLRNWTLKPSPHYPQEVRLKALQLYLEGLGFRSIGRVLNVSNTAVLYWIRQFAEQFKSENGVFKVKDLKAVPYIQIDEFWHWAKKKHANFGFGWLYVPKQNALLPFFVGKETKNQHDSSGPS